MSGNPVAAEILRALAAAMRELAQAAIIWGSPRLSGDVDVTVEYVAPGKVVDTFVRHGFEIIHGDPEFVERTRVIAVVHRETPDPVDLVLAGPGLKEGVAGASDRAECRRPQDPASCRPRIGSRRRSSPGVPGTSTTCGP